MTTKQPFFTVIIVAFNSGDYLDECINALEKQIFKDFEIIIFDNGTKDGSAHSINSSRLNINIINMKLYYILLQFNYKINLTDTASIITSMHFFNNYL